MFVPKTFMQFGKKIYLLQKVLQFGKKYICSKILQFGKNIFVPKLFLIYSYSFEEYGVNVQGFF